MRPLALMLILLVEACSHPPPLASYEFDAPLGEAAGDLTALASAHSALGRIELRRPGLRTQSEVRSDHGEVTIAIPGGAGQREMTLRFALSPQSPERTMVALTIDAPDLGELDLGPQRFAGHKSIERESGKALGSFSDWVNHRTNAANAQQRFERLFDLAAVLNDPALLARAKARGRHEGAVDFLFANPPAPRGFDDD